MTSRPLRCALAALAIVAAGPALAEEAQAPRPMSERDNGIALFGGIHSPDVFSDIVTSPWNTRTESIHLLMPSCNRRLATVLHHLDIEVGAGAGRRFGDDDSVEAFAALGLRYRF